MEYLSVTETAKKWGVSQVLVRKFCREKRIPRVKCHNGIWMIPEDAKRPNSLGIRKSDPEMFYVGNQGRFDAIVRSVLRELKKEYPQIKYTVVLAYMPGKQTEYDDYSDTMIPAGIESVHPRYAISWRNNWMLRQSDYVVTYITHSWGGAFQYVAKAIRNNKRVINLPETVDNSLSLWYK